MTTPEPAGTPPERRRHERLVALAVLGIAAFNYPLLDLFGAPRLIDGVPLLYLYLFSVWILIIVLVARTLHRTSADTSSRDRRS